MPATCVQHLCTVCWLVTNSQASLSVQHLYTDHLPAQAGCACVMCSQLETLPMMHSTLPWSFICNKICVQLLNVIRVIFMTTAAAAQTHAKHTIHAAFHTWWNNQPSARQHPAWHEWCSTIAEKLSHVDIQTDAETDCNLISIRVWALPADTKGTEQFKHPTFTTC